ncbi:MAG: hypothetical protein PHX13_10475 [Thiovulaceae bacterium]|nr:hypothetical protein [Sulfurimonadaceae bacterium]
MNYVSNIILEVMQERFKDDQSYLGDLIEDLKSHENKYDGLMYLFKLDTTSKEMFAQKIGVSLEDIESTLEVLRAL